ncbi:MAG TPA: hypothetical protein VFC74_06870, partial [Oscillospiraceae bacterium]|nr:hypothetical protein [Oscillospiraceae bacterium]
MEKIKNKILIIFISVFVWGCSSNRSICNIDKPMPDYYRLWEKAGDDEIGIKKKLLECGGKNPSGDMISINDSAITYICMVQAGYFLLVSVNGKRENHNVWCMNWPDLAACQKGANIPKPSIEKRLSSDYCKSARNYQFCKENVVNPAACERMD